MRRTWGLVALATVSALALAPHASAGAPTIETIHTGVTGTGEPNIGVAPDGSIYATAMAKTVLSSDGGRHFLDVTPPGHVTTLDPFLYVDKVTGRVYKSDLAGTCQLLSWSDDRGESWTSSAAACNLSDHQSITSAPPVTSPTVGYPRILYNCSQTVGYNGYSAASGCDKSLDGGTTWVPTGTYAFNDPGSAAGDSGVPLHCLGDVGAIMAAGDGTLYVPRGWCGQPWLAVSHDEGLTWTRTQVATNGMNTTLSGGFGIVAPGSGQSDYQATAMADSKGNVAFFWIALNRLPYLAISHNHGASFGAPIMVAPKGVKEAWGPAIDIDAKGRLALAYLASANSPGAPWTGSYAGTDFTGYLARVTGMTAGKLSVTSARLPGDALVAGACSPGRCNSGTLDFIDVAFAKDGAVLGAFVDTRSSRHELILGRLS